MFTRIFVVSARIAKKGCNAGYTLNRNSVKPARNVGINRTGPILNNRPVFQVFYDGGCPLCRREMDWLKKKDVQKNILFTDIQDRQFDETFVGKSQDELMAQIHGRMPDGTWVTGVEVFRQIYGSIGFKIPVMISRLPIVRHALNLCYRVFARYRLRITNRCDAQGCRQV